MNALMSMLSKARNRVLRDGFTGGASGVERGRRSADIELMLLYREKVGLFKKLVWVEGGKGNVFLT